MKCVTVESPFAGKSKLPASLPTMLHWIARKIDEYQNIRFARACVKDVLDRGESPSASHLIFTQKGILDDDIPHERMKGIDAGLAWRRRTDASVVYIDRGITTGMKYGIQAAEEAGIPIVYRSLTHRTEATTIEAIKRLIEEGNLASMHEAC